MKVLVVGANRGIGLELCKQYKQEGCEVVATCRTPSKELNKLSIQFIEKVDAASFEDLQKAASKIGEGSVDILIHNAGIWRTETWEDLNFETIQEQFLINTLGPLKSIKAFYSTLRDAAKIGVLTSRMGSIADNDSGSRYGYRMSKAALNMGLKSLSIDLKDEAKAIAILHPGYVRTDMTDHKGLIDTTESVMGLRKVIGQLNMHNSGSFWHTNGEQIPW